MSPGTDVDGRKATRPESEVVKTNWWIEFCPGYASLSCRGICIPIPGRGCIEGIPLEIGDGNQKSPSSFIIGLLPDKTIKLGGQNLFG